MATLIILGRNNSDETETYQMLWMWWRMQQTYATTMLQMMTKATTTTLKMKTPLPKPERIPILPTHKWEDGGYSQRLCHIGVEAFLLLFLLHFPQTLVTGCVFLVCVCFFQVLF